MNSQLGRSAHILVVDDEPINRKLLEGFLRQMGHTAALAASGEEALALLDDSIDLALVDIMMPGMDGFTLVERIRAIPARAQLPIVMATALSGLEERLRAVEAGANDFITKPIDRTELKVRTESLLKMKFAQDEVRRYQSELENMVRSRTVALNRALEELKTLQAETMSAHLQAIYCLSSAAEHKDEETAQHIQRMSLYAKVLARGLGLPERQVEIITHASPMHDVGKIGVPDAILLKPGKLNEEEWAVMRQHTVFGGRILGRGTSEYLNAAKVIALTHHERWDGQGYPNKLSKTDIPLMGRIIAVADVYDALTSKRPYKEPFTVEVSLDIMRQGREKHFDPEVLDVFLDKQDEIQLIQSTFRDT